MPPVSLTQDSSLSQLATTLALGRRMKVLVADDDITNRAILRSFLSRDGFEVVEAKDGSEAIETFERTQPDIVIMDVMMPNVDGLEATRNIKSQARASERFVPVLFLTGKTGEDSLRDCIHSGGDGFLTKPLRQNIIESHLRAQIRTLAQHERLREQKVELEKHQERLDTESWIARDVMKRVLRTDLLNTPSARYVLEPSDTFNGDLLLSSRGPTGNLSFFLGDFTGHGLPAAIGAVPTSETFYTMTSKGYGPRAILMEMNRKICALLPVGVFCAGTLVEISMQRRCVQVWNGGNPDVLLRSSDGSIRRRFPSTSIPLGIHFEAGFDPKPTVFRYEPGERLYLFSDGVVETPNPQARNFGGERLEACMAPEIPADRVVDTVLERIEEYRDGTPQSDDFTLLEIALDRCGESGAQRLEEECPRIEASSWNSTLEFGADALRTVNPLPIVMNLLDQIQGLIAYKERLSTIITELWANALDHGVLQLSSDLKDGGAGYAEYFRVRDERLNSLDKGSIRIELNHEPRDRGGHLSIRFIDSGDGFDWRNRTASRHPVRLLSGRGLLLIEALSERLIFHGSGNDIEAVFAWGSLED